MDPPRGDEATLTYVGHATLLLEMDGVRLLTDPILRNRVTFLHRHPLRGVEMDRLRHIDGVLISHLHFDHLDLPSLHRLGRDVPLFAPYGAGNLLRGSGFRSVHEMRLGDTVQLGGVRIRATYAEHSPERRPFGLRANSLGYMLQGRYSVYFPGDTDLFPGMEDLHPSLDVALLPVWGWGPTLGAGHMNPARAAEALTKLRPRLAVPIHWGTLHPMMVQRWSAEFLTLPPLDFARHAASAAPDVTIRIIQPGDSISLHQALG